jgi:hypothetical protein
MNFAIRLAFGAQFARHVGGLGNGYLKPGRNHDIDAGGYSGAADMKLAIRLASGAQFARHVGGHGNGCLKPGRNPGLDPGGYPGELLT